MPIIQHCNTVPEDTYLCNVIQLEPSEEIHQSVLQIKNKAEFYASNQEISCRIALIAQVGVTALGICNTIIALTLPSLPFIILSISVVALSIALIITITSMLKKIWELPQSMDFTLRTITKETSISPGLQILLNADKHSLNSLKQVKEESNIVKQDVNKHRKLFHTLQSICFMEEKQVSDHLSTLHFRKNNPVLNSSLVSSPLLNKIVNKVPQLSLSPGKEDDSLLRAHNEDASSVASFNTTKTNFSASFSIPYKTSNTLTQWSLDQEDLSKKITRSFLLSLLVACLSTTSLVLAILLNQWFLLTFSAATILITFGVMLSLGLPLKNLSSGVILSNEIQEDLIQYTKLCVDNSNANLQELTNKQIEILERRRVQMSVIPTETQLYQQEIELLKKQVLELEKILTNDEKKGLAQKKLLLWQKMRDFILAQEPEELPDEAAGAFNATAFPVATPLKPNLKRRNSIG
ncbi:hypothetical protein [Chlamydiifrater phoenicopteri]|uniref:hypothetical protein n=1 Tax=Chlamydiifrater phoenicopteri TaxID=2681469 RepID=UPI001BCDCA90|nr:hypothetical protein [Chlamydiifrater phoenicopteri]